MYIIKALFDTTLANGQLSQLGYCYETFYELSDNYRKRPPQLLDYPIRLFFVLSFRKRQLRDHFQGH